MTSWGDPTGVAHAQVHKTRCYGEVEYNGVYRCNACGKLVSPHSHPVIYAGLFDHRYPNGDFERHPNFNRETYEDGKRELADLAGASA